MGEMPSAVSDRGYNSSRPLPDPGNGGGAEDTISALDIYFPYPVTGPLDNLLAAVGAEDVLAVITGVVAGVDIEETGILTDLLKN